jgi:hypothetical protein
MQSHTSAAASIMLAVVGTALAQSQITPGAPSVPLTAQLMAKPTTVIGC